MKEEGLRVEGLKVEGDGEIQPLHSGHGVSGHTVGPKEIHLVSS